MAWLQGKALTYRKAATAAARSENHDQAEVYRAVAAHLGDVAQEITDYLAAAGR